MANKTGPTRLGFAVLLKFFQYAARFPLSMQEVPTTAIAYIAGTALDGTYQTVVPADTAIAPVDLKVYFLRPVAPDGRDLIATGTLINRSRTVAVATSQVHDADGKLVAVAIGSALILAGRPPSVAGPDTSLT